jgi:hypothetical protein
MKIKNIFCELNIFDHDLQVYFYSFKLETNALTEQVSWHKLELNWWILSLRWDREFYDKAKLRVVKGSRDVEAFSQSKFSPFLIVFLCIFVFFYTDIRALIQSTLWTQTHTRTEILLKCLFMLHYCILE